MKKLMTFTQEELELIRKTIKRSQHSIMTEIVNQTLELDYENRLSDELDSIDSLAFKVEKIIKENSELYND